MKHTLKNRPKWKGLHRTKDIYKEFVSPLLQWFTRFEAEHRKKSTYIERMPEATIQQLRDKVRAYEKYCQEISG